MGELTENEKVVGAGLLGRFADLDIVWSPATKAHFVRGNIRTKYRASGEGSLGVLGFPTSDEIAGAVTGTRKNTFQHGEIITTPNNGTRVVSGGIYQKYHALGDERSPMGLPIGDQFASGSSVRQQFTYGTVSYSTSAGALTSPNATPSLTGVPRTVDSLKDITLNGHISVKVAGVPVNLDVYRDNRFSAYRTVTTRSDGSFTGKIDYAKGDLTVVAVRAAVKGGDGRYRLSPEYKITRGGWQDPVRRAATSADVRYTYRSGCPVGVSRLMVLEQNYYGFDAKMHRGMMVIRNDRIKSVQSIFWHALQTRYPVKKMLNPDAYKGSDPVQMEADNTSAFNCRHVTGNPYAQSPHSYGYAFDVNTVENPYFDGRTWWPSNGTSYIQGGVYNRSPLHKGSLASYSTLTKRAKDLGWFWGGSWNPGRDWQHFQKG